MKISSSFSVVITNSYKKSCRNQTKKMTMQKNWKSRNRKKKIQQMHWKSILYTRKNILRRWRGVRGIGNDLKSVNIIAYNSVKENICISKRLNSSNMIWPRLTRSRISKQALSLITKSLTKLVLMSRMLRQILMQ